MRMEDERSHFQICEVEMTAKDFRDLMSGSGSKVDVTFHSLDRIGKYHSHEAHYFPISEHGPSKPGEIPATIAAEVKKLEGGEDGWVCDTPSRNNKGQWVIIRRRYTDDPVLPPTSLTSDHPVPKRKSSASEKVFEVPPAKGKKGKKK